MSDQPLHPNLTLNIADISDAVKVIDYAADQGGSFKGWTNIRQIMALRDRLEAFVNTATLANAQEEQPLAEAPVGPAPTVS